MASIAAVKQREYLTKNHAGKLLYIPKGEKERSKSRKELVRVLAQKGWTEKDICRGTRMYPCTYRAIMKEISKEGSTSCSVSKNTRKYIKKNAAFWNGKNHRAGTLALQK